MSGSAKQECDRTLGVLRRGGRVVRGHAGRRGEPGRPDRGGRPAAGRGQGGPAAPLPPRPLPAHAARNRATLCRSAAGCSDLMVESIFRFKRPPHLISPGWGRPGRGCHQRSRTRTRRRARRWRGWPTRRRCRCATTCASRWLSTAHLPPSPTVRHRSLVCRAVAFGLLTAPRRPAGGARQARRAARPPRRAAAAGWDRLAPRRGRRIVRRCGAAREPPAGFVLVGALCFLKVLSDESLHRSIVTRAHAPRHRSRRAARRRRRPRPSRCTPCPRL
jgi:hypothetical protein